MQIDKVKQQAKQSVIYTCVLFVISIVCLLIWGLDWRFYVSGGIAVYFLFDAFGEFIKAKDMEQESKSQECDSHDVMEEEPELFELGDYEREGDSCLGMYVPFIGGSVFFEIVDEEQADVITALSKQLPQLEAHFSQFKLQLLQSNELDKDVIDTLQISHIGFYSKTKPDFGEVYFKGNAQGLSYFCSLENLQFKDLVIER